MQAELLRRQSINPTEVHIQVTAGVNAWSALEHAGMHVALCFILQ